MTPNGRRAPTTTPDELSNLRQRAAAVLDSTGVSRRAAIVAVSTGGAAGGPSSGAGDVSVADEVATVLRPGDVVASVGSGAVVLCDRLSEHDDALVIAARIDQVLDGSGASIWLCESCATLTQLDAAIASLDPVLAAPSGHAGWARFDDDLRRRAAERIGMETALRGAADGEGLALNYQAVVDLESRRTTGFEALLRWSRDGRPVAPSTFVPIAEDSGLIVPIGTWAMREATDQLVRWQVGGSQSSLGVGVNVSAHQLGHPDFLEVVRSSLEGADGRAPLDPSTLWLELTESVLLADVDLACRQLDALRDLGLRLVLDDFGTGYSSLTYLRRFPVDAVKLDRSFVSGVAEHPRDVAIVAAVVDLTRALGLDCVAEGVETETQFEILRSMGCHLGQGSLFSVPLPSDQVPAVLAAGTPG